jgi:hypothetical protein
VLGWAQKSGVVDQAGVALLIDLVLAADALTAEQLKGGSAPARRGLNIAAEIALVADLYQVTPKTIRRRRDRTLAALRTARADYLAAVA